MNLLRFCCTVFPHYLVRPAESIDLTLTLTPTGILSSQYIFFDPVSEQTIFDSLLLVQTVSALIVQSLGIGSAALFFLMAVPLFAALVLNPVFTWGKKGEISLVTYGIGSSSSVLTGTMLLLAVVEFFVPLVCTSLSPLFFWGGS